MCLDKVILWKCLHGEEEEVWNQALVYSPRDCRKEEDLAKQKYEESMTRKSESVVS